MLVITAACKLGKFPNQVMAHMDMDDLLEFAGYLHLQNGDREKPESEMDVEDKLLKSLGKPNG